MTFDLVTADALKALQRVVTRTRCIKCAFHFYRRFDAPARCPKCHSDQLREEAK